MTTTYDFTSIMQRKGHDAMAYDAIGNDPWGFAPKLPKDGIDFIPLWVADMNFPTCPSACPRAPLWVLLALR